MNELTRIPSETRSGDTNVSEDLLPLIYRELRRLAAQKMSGERMDHTIDPTALVHEAYIRLVDVKTPQRWNNRGHFYSAAAEAMRRILIESARRRSALKRDVHQFRRVSLDVVDPASPTVASDPDKLVALDQALTRLAKTDPMKAKLVELRYFIGLTIEETAEAMQISTATANRMWAFARAWLQTEIQPSVTATQE